VVGAVVAALALQAFVVLGAEQNAPVESSWTDLPALFAFRVAGGLTIGDVHLSGAWLRANWSVPVVAIAVITLLVVVTVVSTQGWRRVLVLLAVVNSIVFFGVSTMVRGTAALVPVVGQPPPLHSGRYTLLPALLLVICVAVLFDVALTGRTTHAAIAGGVATVWLAVVMVASFIIAPLPDGPSWEQGLEEARGECTIGSDADVVVEIAPNPAWIVQLPCSDL
jgi:hypothetical protein